MTIGYLGGVSDETILGILVTIQPMFFIGVMRYASKARKTMVIPVDRLAKRSSTVFWLNSYEFWNQLSHRV